MRKPCVFLLLLLIVCCPGFAKLSGVATAFQRFDFNTNAIDYNVYTTVYGSFVIDFLKALGDTGEKKGNELPYTVFELSATIGAASAEFHFKGSEPQRDAIGDWIDDAKIGDPVVVKFGENGYELALPFWDADHNTDMRKTFPLYVLFRIKTFKTIGDGWSLDLISVPDPADYAKGTTFFGTGFIDFNRDAAGNQIYVPCWYDYSYSYLKANSKGFTFQYDDIGKIGVAISNLDFDGIRRNLSLYVMAETADLYLSDYLTMKASIAAGKAEDSTRPGFGASVFIQYENDLYFSIASDFGYDGSFDAEVHADGSYGAFSGELYYSTYAESWYYDKYVGKDHRTFGYGGTTPVRNYLGISLSVDMSSVLPSLNPDLQLFGKNIIQKDANIGFKVTASYAPYVMAFEAGMQNLTNGRISGYVKASTDFTDYMDLPFSSLILQVGDGVSLDAFDMIPGLDAGIFGNSFLESGEWGAGLRVSYTNTTLETGLIGKYCFAIKRFAGELYMDYYLSRSLTLSADVGFGSLKDIHGYYCFDNRLHAIAGVSFANSKMKVGTGIQVVLADAFGFGAYVEAEIYIIDGAVITVSYNPREEKTGRILNLDDEHRGVLEAAYSVKY